MPSPRCHPDAPPRPSCALRPVTTGNALPAMSYRNCWHIFSPGLSGRRRLLRPPRLVPRHGTQRTSACSDFRPVTKIPHCCLWRGSFQPQVAGRPLSPARDRRLGAPTPNPPRAHLGAARGLHAGMTGPPSQHLAYYAPLGRRHPTTCGWGPTRMCQASCAHSPRTIVKFTQPPRLPPLHPSTRCSALEVGCWATPPCPQHTTRVGRPGGSLLVLRGALQAKRARFPL